MLRLLILVLALLPIGVASTCSAQNTATAAAILQRRYKDGAVSHYVMTGDNDGRHYSIQATDLVKRDPHDRYYEEISWANLTSKAGQKLTPESVAFRQTVSLDDPITYMKVPNLANVQPQLIGPITDTLTFYSDLLLALNAKLVQSGQTAYIARTTPNSWADGQRVLLGQDVVDFSLKVESVNAVDFTETILVQHIPPPDLHIQLPAQWMHAPISTKPANFVQVSRQGDGYIAQKGKETFDVRLIIDTRDGHILSATMHNPVLLTTRNCTDRELNQCGPESSQTIVRDITLDSIP